MAEIWRREGPLPVIIFVTAYDQFALEAFRLNAVDYLTKPIDPDRFAESLDRVRTLLKELDRDELDRRIQAMLDMHERRQAVRPHIVVHERERYVLVPASEIHCLEATGNYVSVHCERANDILRSTLSALEAKLDPDRFVRVHRSWIVNVEQIREAQPLSKSTWILVTRGGHQVPVGQQYREILLSILK